MNHEDVALSKTLRDRNGSDCVVFSINGFFEHGDYTPGYPQIHPVLEYYADAPILCFNSVDTLVANLQWLWRKSEYPFSPIMVSSSKSDIEKVYQLLRETNIVTNAVSMLEIKKIEGRYVVDLNTWLYTEKRGSNQRR